MIPQSGRPQAAPGRIAGAATVIGGWASEDKDRGDGEREFFIVRIDLLGLRFEKAVIAIGSGPVIPRVPGLAAASYLTDEKVFERPNAAIRLNRVEANEASVREEYFDAGSGRHRHGVKAAAESADFPHPSHGGEGRRLVEAE